MTRSPQSPRSRTRTIAIGRVILFASILGAWAAGTASGFISPYVLPGPVAVFQALGASAISPELWIALGNTLGSWILGLAIAFVGGNILGLAIGSSRLAVVLTRSTIDLLRCVPAVTLVPLALLLYGTSINMKLMLIVYGAIWEVIVQAIYASKQIDKVADATMRVYGVRGALRVRALLLPSAAPFIVTGFRVAAVVAFLLCLGSEVIGGAPGLGSELEAAHADGYFAGMWAYIIVAATFGVVLNIVLGSFDRRILRGHPGYRAEVPA
ncbi:ABC transporter permease subunit [soil metagenome]